jgi:hypothetical protein
MGNATEVGAQHAAPVQTAISAIEQDRINKGRFETCPYIPNHIRK